MRLDSRILPVNEIPAARVDEMVALMDAHYEGVTRATLVADLMAKDRVILLLSDGELRGFSTQVAFEHGPVRVVFSGDTIIDRRHWGSNALAVAWCRMMLDLLAEDPARPLYWLLISKGYKTYRFLTVFFREFLPCFEREADPRELRLLDDIARSRFGARYDAASGVLPAVPGGQRLRPGLADLDERRLRDPHLEYFQRRNPGHARGDDLVCLARFHPDNLRPYILRQSR